MSLHRTGTPETGSRVESCITNHARVHSVQTCAIRFFRPLVQSPYLADSVSEPHEPQRGSENTQKPPGLFTEEGTNPPRETSPSEHSLKNLCAQLPGVGAETSRLDRALDGAEPEDPVDFSRCDPGTPADPLRFLSTLFLSLCLGKLTKFPFIWNQAQL